MARKTSANIPRILFIDLLRTLAILMMIAFHTAFDLQELHRWNIDVFSGGWDLLRIATGTLFIGLTGLSTHFSKHPYKRAGRILAAAALVSVATFVWDPETYVRFGILHLIGVTVLVLPLLKRLGAANIVLGIVIILAGNAWSGMIVNTHMLLPFGFLPPMFSTLDYYPLLPWSGVAMIGYGIGSLVNISQSTKQKTKNPKPAMHLLTLPGRHALAIYLVHQPVIIILLGLMFRTNH